MIELAATTGLIALLALPIILWLFSLRPKRRTVTISSASLWREVLTERAQGIGIRKFLRNLSLLLSLLAAIGIALALAQPQWLTLAKEPGDIILIVDTSASMKAARGDTTRFAFALDEAEARIDALPQSHRLLLMSSGRKPRLLSGFERDKRILKERLQSLVAGDEVGDPQAAVALALSLSSGRDEARIVFVTDGAFDMPLSGGGVRIDIANVQTGDGALALAVDAAESAAAPRPRNIAITRFQLRRELGSQSDYEVLIRVRSYVDEPVSVPLRLTLDGQALTQRELNLAPQANESIYLRMQTNRAGRVRAQIDSDDDLSADNVAHANLSHEGALRVLLVGPGNPYLRSLFAAMARVELTERSAISADELAVAARRHDVVVLDRTPAERLPAGRFVVYRDLPGGFPLIANGEQRDVVISGVGGGADIALLQGMDFGAVRIDATQRIGAVRDAFGLQRWLWSAETGLVWSFVRNDLRLVYFGFDLLASNLPRQAVFPLLMHETVDWLVRGRAGRDDSDYGQIEAGETFEIDAPRNAEVLLRLPSSEGLVLRADATPIAFDDTSQAGFYRYTVNGITRDFAVNLVSERESDIRPRTGRAGGASDAALTTVTSPVQETRVVRPLWTHLAVLALLILWVEWLLWLWGRRA